MSDLLPSTFEEFRSKDYWDKFFVNRGDKPFEWYGEWKDLWKLFSKHIKKDDSIIQFGCGNSVIATRLYDSGYENIVNIDFSTVCIDDMIRQNSKLRPKMQWEVRDMTDTKHEPASYDVVLDKGALDAVMGADDHAALVVGFGTTAEAKRLLKVGGRYICISLVQSHVLYNIAASFQKGWNVDFFPVPALSDMKQAELQPFFIVCTKTENKENLPINLHFTRESYLCNKQQVEDIFDAITKANETRIKNELLPLPDLIENLKEIKCGQIFKKKICEDRFSVTIVDAKNKNDSFSLQCAVFIVPQGKEHEWFFCDENEGLWELHKSCNALRLIVVALNRGHTFGNMEEVQSELSPEIIKLSHTDGEVEKIPFMTSGDGLGSRDAVGSYTSELTGIVSVEDVDDDDNGRVRRLVFERNSNMIQTEVVLKKNTNEFDFNILTGGFHRAMVSALMTFTDIFNPEEKDLLLIGLGGGSLAMYLSKILHFHVQAIELDPIIVDVAKKHFGCQDIETFVADGIQYIADLKIEDETTSANADTTQEQDKQQKKTKKKHAIFIDADSGDMTLGLSAPPLPFLDRDFLEHVYSALNDEDGIMVMNVVARSQIKYRECITAINEVFKTIYEFGADGDINQIIVGVKNPKNASSHAHRIFKDKLGTPVSNTTLKEINASVFLLQINDDKIEKKQITVSSLGASLGPSKKNNNGNSKKNNNKNKKKGGKRR